MVKILSSESPEIRVHVGDGSVKFRAGVAEVSDEIAEALLAIEWLALERAGDEPAEAQPLEDEPAGDDDAVVSAEPVKRKPGRPKKPESAE